MLQLFKNFYLFFSTREICSCALPLQILSSIISLTFVGITYNFHHNVLNLESTLPTFPETMISKTVMPLFPAFRNKCQVD